MTTIASNPPTPDTPANTISTTSKRDIKTEALLIVQQEIADRQRRQREEEERREREHASRLAAFRDEITAAVTPDFWESLDAEWHHDTNRPYVRFLIGEDEWTVHAINRRDLSEPCYGILSPRENYYDVLASQLEHAILRDIGWHLHTLAQRPLDDKDDDDGQDDGDDPMPEDIPF